jgi:hypothetical protein
MGLIHDFISQRFQTFFFGHGGPGPLLGFKGQVDIFQFLQLIATRYFLLELVGEFPLLFNAF